MSSSILIGYATRYSSTWEVAEMINGSLQEKGLTAEIKPLQEINNLDGIRAFIIGAPLFMFRWHKDALRLQKPDTLATFGQ
jgi:menaquinone-dependent protoporphyrinogen oxidase